jgi:hypothetical protein
MTGPGIADVELAMKEGYSTATDRVREMGFGAGWVAKYEKMLRQIICNYLQRNRYS